MGQFHNFLSWYRLKSNDKHLFLKISGKGYLEIQPENDADAEAFAEETIEVCQNLRDIVEQDKRNLWIKLDLRGMEFSCVYPILLAKYARMALSQGIDIDHVEIYGGGQWFPYFIGLLPSYVQEVVEFK